VGDRGLHHILLESRDTGWLLEVTENWWEGYFTKRVT
jgi:hypothetical protein